MSSCQLMNSYFSERLGISSTIIDLSWNCIARISLDDSLIRLKNNLLMGGCISRYIKMLQDGEASGARCLFSSLLRSLQKFWAPKQEIWIFQDSPRPNDIHVMSCDVLVDVFSETMPDAWCIYVDPGVMWSWHVDGSDTCFHDIDLKDLAILNVFPATNARSHKSLTAQSWRRGRGAAQVDSNHKLIDINLT